MNSVQTPFKFHKSVVSRGRGLPTLVLLGLLALGGCGGQDGGAPVEGDSSAETTTAGAEAGDGTGAKAAGSPGGATAQLIQSAAAVPRKIIYNATVDLIADNFSTAQRSLLSLIQKHRGYVAETDIDGTPGTPREGTWKVRVPADQFQGFMTAVTKLGELQTTQIESQDVTEEFYDLQARISNKQVEERRLLDHLQRSTAKLSDILQVEREISRVRGEIEQMQGRLRLLANQTSLTTITITLHEVKGYVAPKPTTFGSQIARAFETSISALLDLGKALVVLVVAVLPWAAILALIGVPLWRLARRFSPKP